MQYLGIHILIPKKYLEIGKSKMNFIFDSVQHILQLNGSLKFLYSVPSESLKIHPTLSRPPTIKIMVGGKQLGQIRFENSDPLLFIIIFPACF